MLRKGQDQKQDDSFVINVQSKMYPFDMVGYLHNKDLTCQDHNPYPICSSHPALSDFQHKAECI